MGLFDFNKHKIKKDSLEAIVCVVYLIAVSGDGIKRDESEALSFLYYWLLYESKSKKPNHIPSPRTKSGKEFEKLLIDQKKLKSEIKKINSILSMRTDAALDEIKINFSHESHEEYMNIREGYRNCINILTRVNKEFGKSVNKGNTDKIRDKYYQLITDKYNREITLKIANAVAGIDGLNKYESHNIIDLKMYWMADEI